MSLAKNHPLYLIVLVLWVVAGCGGGGGGSTSRDMTDPSIGYDGHSQCPATVTTNHLCNAFTSLGFCFYQDTDLACVYCGAPDTGCIGTFDRNGTTYRFICTNSCDECQPATPSACFTE
jgi:hypothetical protein